MTRPIGFLLLALPAATLADLTSSELEWMQHLDPGTPASVLLWSEETPQFMERRAGGPSRKSLHP